MVVTIRLVVMAMRPATIHIPVKESEPFKDCDKAVKILGMQVEDIWSICSVMTALPYTVIMLS